MENQQQQQQQSGLCRSGCGFYGSAVTEGLCSKCFKDSIKRTQDTTTPRIGQSSNNIPKSIMSDSMDASTSMDVSHSSTGQSALIPMEQSLAAVAPEDNCKSPMLETKNDVSADTTLKAARESLTTLSASSSSSSFGEISGADGTPSLPGGPAKKPNRCHMCKKRVGLTGFVCRCGGLYCGEHRYDKAHDCVFDYKTMEREEIRKNNPVVVSDKIQRL